MLSEFNGVPIVKQPKGLQIDLFMHQLANVYKMEQFEINKRIELPDETKETVLGYLTDDTGTGKTLCIIGLLCRDRMQWNIDLSHTVEKITTIADHKIKSHNFIRYEKLKSNLILVSKSILYQWIEEIKKSNLTYIAIESNKQIEKEEVSKYDVVITTPKFFNKLISYYKNYAWKRFIFDEPGHLRVPAMKHVIAGFYWFITATPEAIYYKHRKCKSSFMESIIEPIKYKTFEDVYEGVIIKNTTEFINLSFQSQPIHYFKYRCYQPLYDVINGLVSPMVDSMLESGNIEGVISHLGGKKTSNVVELIKNIKNNEIGNLHKKISLYNTEDSFNQDKIKLLKNQIFRMEKQLSTLDDRFNSLLTQNCPICCDKLDKPVIEPECHNIFCGKCIIEWLKIKKSCPICRVKTNFSNLVYIQDSSEKQKSNKSDKNNFQTKPQVIIDIIKSKMKNKFLIFSRYEGSFKTIIRTLEEYKISYSQMKGNSKKRKKIIEKFNNGDIQVIFLNSENDGSGINLQKTDDIILYHEMPEYYIKQIVGRAMRIGRTKELNIHILHL